MQIAATRPLEWLAVVCAILYLLLAIRESLWCWLFAAISSTTYIYLMFAAQLYMESLLNVYYLAMAGYGWFTWRFGTAGADSRPVMTMPPRMHAAAILLIVGLSAASGWFLSRHTEAALPFFDSLTTFGALWTTFLVARKVFENWWYWLVIDAVSIVLYVHRDLYLTALLFLVYLAMIPFGMRAWRRSMREARGV